MDEQSFVQEIPSLFGQRVALKYSIPFTINGECNLMVFAARCSDNAHQAINNSENEAIPLFANYIWPGSIVLADYLQMHSEVVCNKNILELGAGAALPSLVSSKLGANLVVATDYADPLILNNINYLKDINKCINMMAYPYTWGDKNEAATLKRSLLSNKGFDVILLGEVLWKNTYPLHDVLISSIEECLLKPNGIVLVAFAHRPTHDHTSQHDMEFIQRLEERLQLKSTNLYSTKKYKDALESDFVEVFLYHFAQPIVHLDHQLLLRS
jgi:nicotinamide N-methyltransferase